MTGLGLIARSAATRPQLAPSARKPKIAATRALKSPLSRATRVRPMRFSPTARPLSSSGVMGSAAAFGYPLLEEFGARAGRGLGLERLGDEPQLLVEGHDGAGHTPIPLVGRGQAQRLGGGRQDAGADDGRLAVLRNGEPLFVAGEAGRALVDAGGQGDAPAQLGGAGHGNRGVPSVDDHRIAPAGLDQEVTVIEGHRRLDVAVDGQQRAGPQLDLRLGQLEDGPAVDDPDLVLGPQGSAVGRPDEGGRRPPRSPRCRWVRGGRCPERPCCGRRCRCRPRRGRR